MTQDCSLTPSIADENESIDNKRFPKDIHVTETDKESGLGIEDVSNGKEEGKGNVTHRNAEDGEKEKPWGYLLIHNRQVDLFKKQVDDYNHLHPEAAHECFIHYSYMYKKKKGGKGVVKKLLPTVSGLVFLQGRTVELQTFLRANYPQYHLINNCSTGKPASIAHKVMKPFMELVSSHPENVTFLRDPFVKFAKDHVNLRVITGLFKGLEGYIIRVDRDRQLVMELGGYAVAIRGVHNEDFEVVEEQEASKPAKHNISESSTGNT